MDRREFFKNMFLAGAVVAVPHYIIPDEDWDNDWDWDEEVEETSDYSVERTVDFKECNAVLMYKDKIIATSHNGMFTQDLNRIDITTNDDMIQGRGKQYLDGPKSWRIRMADARVTMGEKPFYHFVRDYREPCQILIRYDGLELMGDVMMNEASVNIGMRDDITWDLGLEGSGAVIIK